MHCLQESSSAILLVGDGKSPKPTAWLCLAGNDAPHSVNGSKGTEGARPVRGSVMTTPREKVLELHRQHWVTSSEKALTIPLCSRGRSMFILS